MIKNTGSLEEKADGRNLTVILRGEIDHHNAVTFRTGIDRMVCEKRPKKLILDLSHIEFMDSSGLGLIMGRYALIQKLGGEMIIRNPSDAVLKICRLAGIGRLVRIETKA